MRKNKMMRAASALLVAVLLTTSVISGTFAKYVTTAEASDTARVAKFGVVIQADGGLFNDTYLKATNTPANTGTMSVQSLPADEDLVAPGTKNDDGLKFSITGQPEVATKLDVTIESENIYLMNNKYAVPVAAPEVSETSFKTGTYYIKDGENYKLADPDEFDGGSTYYTMQDVCDLAAPYYPVVFESEDFTTGTIASDSLDAIAAGYAQKLNNNVAVAASAPVAGKRTYTITAKEYAPNFDYASLGVADETLKWKWEYENLDKDPADTILGHLQAGKTVVKWDTDKYVPTVAAAGAELNDYNLEVGFRAQFTVTQLD